MVQAEVGRGEGSRLGWGDGKRVILACSCLSCLRLWWVRGEWREVERCVGGAGA